jgi:hypothetical protein
MGCTPRPPRGAPGCCPRWCGLEGAVQEAVGRWLRGRLGGVGRSRPGQPQQQQAAVERQGTGAAGAQSKEEAGQQQCKSGRIQSAREQLLPARLEPQAAWGVTPVTNTSHRVGATGRRANMPGCRTNIQYHNALVVGCKETQFAVSAFVSACILLPRKHGHPSSRTSGSTRSPVRNPNASLRSVYEPLHKA